MRISYSAFDTFTLCPLKYKYSYIERIKTPEKPELYFGGLIHEIVQIALKKDPIIPPVQDLVKYLEDHFDEKIFPSKLEAEQYLELGRSMLRNFHSSLTPGLRNIIATEKRFQIPLNEKHVLSGIIDRVDKLPFGAYEVIDYKTSKKPETQDEVDKNKQLGLYKYAVKQMWPEAEDIRLTLYYLKHPIQLTTTRNDEEVENLKEEVIETAEKIEKETEFAPRANQFCDWCDFQKLCPLQKQKFTNSEQTTIDNKIDNIVEDYIEAHQKFRALEPKIHKHFDSEKIERFFHKKGTLTRGKTKKLTIKKN